LVGVADRSLVSSDDLLRASGAATEEAPLLEPAAAAAAAAIAAGTPPTPSSPLDPPAPSGSNALSALARAPSLRTSLGGSAELSGGAVCLSPSGACRLRGSSSSDQSEKYHGTIGFQALSNPDEASTPCIFERLSSPISSLEAASGNAKSSGLLTGSVDAYALLASS